MSNIIKWTYIDIFQHKYTVNNLINILSLLNANLREDRASRLVFLKKYRI